MIVEIFICRGSELYQLLSDLNRADFKKAIKSFNDNFNDKKIISGYHILSGYFLRIKYDFVPESSFESNSLVKKELINLLKNKNKS